MGLRVDHDTHPKFPGSINLPGRRRIQGNAEKKIHMHHQCSQIVRHVISKLWGRVCFFLPLAQHMYVYEGVRSLKQGESSFVSWTSASA